MYPFIRLLSIGGIESENYNTIRSMKVSILLLINSFIDIRDNNGKLYKLIN